MQSNDDKQQQATTNGNDWLPQQAATNDNKNWLQPQWQHNERQQWLASAPAGKTMRKNKWRWQDLAPAARQRAMTGTGFGPSRQTWNSRTSNYDAASGGATFQEMTNETRGETTGQDDCRLQIKGRLVSVEFVLAETQPWGSEQRRWQDGLDSNSMLWVHRLVGNLYTVYLVYCACTLQSYVIYSNKAGGRVQVTEGDIKGASHNRRSSVCPLHAGTHESWHWGKTCDHQFRKLLQSMNKVRNRTKDSKIERYLPRVDELMSSVWCEWWWWGYEEGDVALKCLINQSQPSLYNKLHHRKSTKSNITKIIIQNHNTWLQ